jgi:GntR family transcriptional regulator
LRSKIQNGEFQEGHLIPKEVELAALFQVSRPTVRQAVQELVNQGYLEKRKRRGTIVTSRKISQEFTHVIESYNKEMNSKGLTTATQVLSFRSEQASAEVQAALGLDHGAKVYRLERLRFANEQPVVWVTSFVPFRPLPKLGQVDFTQQSLYTELAKAQHKIVRVRRKLEVMVADESASVMLHIAVNAPIFYFHTWGATVSGEIFEYSVAKYRGDINSFQFEINQRS